MTDPGKLDQRLTLEVPVETADGAGGVIRSYQAGPMLWASVMPLRAQAELAAAGLGATVTHRITVRMRADITTRHRLRKGTRIFRIVSLREADARGRFLVIDAQERRD